MYAGERIGVTRNGKLAAVVVSVDDLEALEAFEMAEDIAAYREAKAQDDGSRVSLDELRADLAALLSHRVHYRGCRTGHEAAAARPRQGARRDHRPGRQPACHS